MTIIYESKQMRKIRIDLVSDVVCPWCYVGYRRLQQALDTMENPVEADIIWHPFELNPQMAKGGENLRDHLIGKYQISVAQSQQARDNLTQIGKDLGISFNFTDDMRIYNTFLAHQLLAYAAEQGRQTEMKLRLFEAYFTEGQQIDQIDVLCQIAESIGFDPAVVLDMLTQQSYQKSVREDQAFWQAQGIQAVPALIFNQKSLVSGAQESATLQQVIEDHLG